jgi:hypothetical protein
MQITINNDFANGPRPFTPQEIASFLQDEQTAVNMLNSTFTNNISLTFDVGFGSFEGVNLDVFPGVNTQNTSLGNINFARADFLTYSQLRTELLQDGQPNFFTPINLPAGNSINGISNFLISSSVAAAFRLPVPINGQADGFVGIGTAFTSGPVRVAAFLHEIGHAMGRISTNFTTPQGVTWFTEFDLMRFVTPGARLFDGTIPPMGGPPVPAAYFSLDGGASRLADWGLWSDPSDFLNPANTSLPGPYSDLTPNDPFNEIVGDLAQLTTLDIQSMEALGFRSTLAVINPPPPAGTTAVMVLRLTSVPPSITDGTYQIYDIGRNSILATFQLGQVGTDWRFVTLGGFNGTDPTDMLLRNVNTGAFQVYDINSNTIVGSASLGAVGLNWQVTGFGTFGSVGNSGETDMMLRDVNTGGLQIYNIRNNQITGSAFIGTVGLDWQFSGIGNFSGRGTSDMMLRNSNSGGLQVYNISNNQITGSAFIGNVGLDWQFSGIGNFSSVPGESDLLLRNASTGALQVYNVNNNQLTGSASLGAVGLDWQFAGVAPVSAPGRSDLVLRNVNTGAFQAYNIAFNSLTGSASLGAVGLDWQLGGLGATGGSSGGPFNSQPAAMDGSPSQLVQAMASFGGGAADNSATVPLGADALQQTFLTTPHA